MYVFRSWSRSGGSWVRTSRALRAFTCSMVGKAEYLLIEVEAVNGTNPNAVRDVMSRSRSTASTCRGSLGGGSKAGALWLDYPLRRFVSISPVLERTTGSLCFKYQSFETAQLSLARRSFAQRLVWRRSEWLSGCRLTLSACVRSV